MAELYKYKYDENYTKKANGVNKVINCPTANADMIRHVLYLQPSSILREVMEMNGHGPTDDIFAVSEELWRKNREKRQLSLEQANEATEHTAKWKKEHGLIRQKDERTV